MNISDSWNSLKLCSLKNCDLFSWNEIYWHNLKHGNLEINSLSSFDKNYPCIFLLFSASINLLGMDKLAVHFSSKVSHHYNPVTFDVVLYNNILRKWLLILMETLWDIINSNHSKIFHEPNNLIIKFYPKWAALKK